MTTTAVQPLDDTRRAELVETLTTDGIIGLKGAFAPEWADVLGEDVMAAFEEAKVRPGGAIGRGPQRWYVEVHPEQIRGFADLAGHPWIVQVATEVLGADYEIVEVGFDIPFAGALDQPWHRDFPMGDYTRRLKKLNSLAVNVTCVDTTDDMGPFEIAPGTQWDDSEEFDHGMFPPRSHYPRYVERAVRKYPQRGDISIRSALTIHRGTANRSNQARPVLVVGVDAPDATNAGHHDLQITRAYEASLPPRIRDHLTYRVVDELEFVVQQHVIEGLLKPDY